MRTLNYGRHLVEDDDVEAVVSVLRGDLITQGPIVAAFEAALAERVAAKYAVAVTSGTAGLHLAALAAGVAPGGLGLTSAITFVASANSVLFCGGEVALCDIDRDTLNMAPSALRDALARQPEISLVIPVHFAGLPTNAEELRKAAGSRVVIEDACHSLGARYECGRPVGCCAYSDMTVFSFHPVKPITTGEGGAIVTNDKDLARRLRLLRTHGITRDPAEFSYPDSAFEGEQLRSWYCEQQLLGFNYRMTDIQAALGLSQLKKLERFINRRREIAVHYDEAIADLPYLRIPQSEPHLRARSGHHLYVVEFDLEALGMSRLQVARRLLAENVGTQVHYIPVYRHPYHQRRSGFEASDFPRSEAYYRGCLSMPNFPGMSDAEVARVIDAVRGLGDGRSPALAQTKRSVT